MNSTRIGTMKTYKISCRLGARYGSGGVVMTVKARSYLKAVRALAATHPEINIGTCALVECTEES